MPTVPRSGLTVGELRRLLGAYPDTADLYLPGDLSFYRLKQRGENLICLEVNEPAGFCTDEFKARNPNVLCVFIASPPFDGVLGPELDVTVD